jgi:hypothetical protein
MKSDSRRRERAENKDRMRLVRQDAAARAAEQRDNTATRALCRTDEETRATEQRANSTAHKCHRDAAMRAVRTALHARGSAEALRENN